MVEEMGWPLVPEFFYQTASYLRKRRFSTDFRS